MIRLVPPIAVPFGADSVLASVLARGRVTTFESALARATGSNRVELFGSGRAALAAWLGGRRRPGRDEVLLPAYTCFSVPAAAVRARLRVRLYDVDPISCEADLDSLSRTPLARVEAVVLAHLFGLGGSIGEAIATLRAADPELRILEDCAQAWPSPRSGSPDARLLSFGRGKPLPLGGGGALAHDGEPLSNGPQPGGAGWFEAMKLGATCVLARPAWYRIPESLPFLRVGETVYDPDFDDAVPFPAWRAALGARVIGRLPEWVRRRADNAARVAGALADVPGFRVIGPDHSHGPLRLALLAPDASKRRAFVAAARRRGVAAGAMYPGTLADIPALRPHLADRSPAVPGAVELASRLVTLPVHPGLSERDVERVAATALAAAREAR